MNKKAFTIIEILVVVILVSVIAGFSISSFQKSMKKAKVRDSVLRMNVIIGSMKMYIAKNGKVPSAPFGTAFSNLKEQLNLGFDLPSNVTFRYSTPFSMFGRGTSHPNAFSFTMDVKDGGYFAYISPENAPQMWRYSVVGQICTTRGSVEGFKSCRKGRGRYR